MKVLGKYFQQQTSVKIKLDVAANLIKGVFRRLIPSILTTIVSSLLKGLDG